MTWSFVNDCNDPISLRLFDETNGTESDIYTLAGGQSGTRPFTCKTGDTICFGARDKNTLGSWGKDIDGSGTCTNCCAICANQSVDPGPLTC